MDTESTTQTRSVTASGAWPTAASLLFGRERELAELEAALQRAVERRKPEVVTVLGAAGVGKTRFIHEFAVRAAGRARVLVASASDRGPAFAAVHAVLRERFSLENVGDDEQGRAHFRSMVERALGDHRVSEFLHFLGAYVGLHFPDSPFVKAIDEDPRQFSLVSRAVLRRFFEVDADARPLVLVFDDLHRATDDMLGLAHYLARSLRDAPILMILAGQPELGTRRPDWFDAPAGRHHRVDLAPLDAPTAAALMVQLLSPLGDPPPALIQTAVGSAAGSPYLLEEMVRVYRRSGVIELRGDGKFDVDLSKLDRATLPLSVDEAVEARIASLQPLDRELLEMAAAIGETFWVGALVALKRIDDRAPDLWGGHESTTAHVLEQLARLAERDFVVEAAESTVIGEKEFVFKHSAERDTIVRLTHRSRGASWHRRVGEWLEVRLGNRADTQSELLAEHFELASVGMKSARYYILAGDRARERHAISKAIAYYGRGIELAGETDLGLSLYALHHFGDVLQLAGRNDAALRAFRGMLDVAFRLNLKDKGGAAHNRLGRLYRAIGQLDEAMRHLGTGLALFEATEDLRGIASSLDDIGKVHWMRGNYAAAERFMQQALERREELGDRRSIALSHNNLGLVFQDSGRFGEALGAFQRALALQQEIDDRAGIAQTMNNLGTVYQDNSEHDGAIERYRSALAMAKEVGDRMRQAVILTNLGESHYRLQRPKEAIELLTEAEEISATLGDLILEGEIHRGLAKARLLMRETLLAKDHVGRAIEKFERAKGRPFLGVALRTKGEIHASANDDANDPREAEKAFESAIKIFEEVGNEVELARTCEALAGFLERMGAAKSKRVKELWAKASAVRVRQMDPEDPSTPVVEGA
ncbi:MAG: tetratricopeptide repeat protein [Polyangiales bacterium]